MAISADFRMDVLPSLHDELRWVRARCLALARGTGRTRDACEDLADELVAEVTAAFLDAPEWFDGPSRCIEARVRHRLALLVRQRATALYRAEAKARFPLTGDEADPAEAVDEVLARREWVTHTERWVRTALDGQPGRLVAVLFVDLPHALTQADVEASAPARGGDEAWALFQDFAPRSDQHGWRSIVAEILRGTGPVGTVAARDRARMVNSLEHTLIRAYAAISSFVHATGPA